MSEITQGVRCHYCVADAYLDGALSPFLANPCLVGGDYTCEPCATDLGANVPVPSDVTYYPAELVNAAPPAIQTHRSGLALTEDDRARAAMEAELAAQHREQQPPHADPVVAEDLELSGAHVADPPPSEVETEAPPPPTD